MKKCKQNKGKRERQTYLQTHTDTFWGEGDTFDEKHNKEQRTGQAFRRHITNAKMKEKEGAKDKHIYRHTLSRSGGEGDTFDEEQNKEQDNRSPSKHIVIASEGRREEHT